MEVKVLAAVFLTLFGMAVAMGQGELTADELTDMGEIMSRFQDNLQKIGESGSGILDGIGGGGGSSEPANTTLSASFTASEDRRSIRMREKVDTVAVNGSDINISVSGLDARPESAYIVFRNYTGDMAFDGNVTMSGKAEVVAFGDLSFDSDSAENVDLYVDDPVSLEVDPMPRSDMSFAGVSGRFSSDGSFELDDGAAELRSFTGSFQKQYDGNYTLDGKVHSAVLEEGNSRTEIGGTE
jgi:hypothetical protein